LLKKPLSERRKRSRADQDLRCQNLRSTRRVSGVDYANG
jgi:hypothetical protein